MPWFFLSARIIFLLFVESFDLYTPKYFLRLFNTKHIVAVWCPEQMFKCFSISIEACRPSLKLATASYTANCNLSNEQYFVLGARSQIIELNFRFGFGSYHVNTFSVHSPLSNLDRSVLLILQYRETNLNQVYIN